SKLVALCCFMVLSPFPSYYHPLPPLSLSSLSLLPLFPFPSDAILLLLILHYNGSLRMGLIYAFLFVGGWRLLTLKKWIIDLAMSLCTFISAASKFAQLQCLWSSKDAAQVSTSTWAMATCTCFVLVRFGVMTLLNLWVLLTVIYYQRASRSKKKD
uniref:Solute carrier family 66 member 3 n=1 Tax=Oryzias latipes TaxID=8090 RepID=A0A3P9LZ03_ORYLA